MCSTTRSWSKRATRASRCTCSSRRPSASHTSTTSRSCSSRRPSRSERTRPSSSAADSGPRRGSRSSSRRATSGALPFTSAIAPRASLSARGGFAAERARHLRGEHRPFRALVGDRPRRQRARRAEPRRDSGAARAAPPQRDDLPLEPRLLRHLRERQAAPPDRAPHPPVRADNRRRGRERGVLARADERDAAYGRRHPGADRLRSRAGEPVRRPRATGSARGSRGSTARRCSRSRSSSTACCRSRRRGSIARGSMRRTRRATSASSSSECGPCVRLALDAPVARGDEGARLERGAATALVAATIARQKTDRVVSEWERARLDEVGEEKSGSNGSRST